MMQRRGRKSLPTETRHRVAIQAVTNTADGEGGFTQAWVTLSTVWAAIYPAREVQETGDRTIDVEATHIVRIRGDVTIAEENRLLFGVREFEIISVADFQERGVVYEVQCKEVRD